MSFKFQIFLMGAQLKFRSSYQSAVNLTGFPRWVVLFLECGFDSPSLFHFVPLRCDPKGFECFLAVSRSFFPNILGKNLF